MVFNSLPYRHDLLRCMVDLKEKMYNSQCTKGSMSLVQRFKIRTFCYVCTKATRTLCEL